MARYLPYLLLFFSVALFGGFALILSDVSGAQLRHRNTQRQEDLNFILDKIEDFAKEHRSLPGISQTVQQIGTEDTGCALHTSSCDIQNDQCAKLHTLMNDRDLSLPADLKIGSYYKTGYAVSYDSSNQTVTVTACGAEAGENISAQRSFKGLFSPAATPSGVQDVKK